MPISISLDNNKIAAAFYDISGQDPDHAYPMLVLAAAQIERRLRENVDPDDPRIVFLTAATALYYSAQINAAKKIPSANIVLGSSLSQKNLDYGSNLTYVKALVDSFSIAAAPLLSSHSDFLFRLTN